MEHSAGIAITDGYSLLSLQPFGKKKGQSNSRDIPKGRVENDESLSKAAIREAKEEIGLELDPLKLQKIKTFDNYRPNKKLTLFLLVYTELPDTGPMYCSEYFDI